MGGETRIYHLRKATLNSDGRLRHAARMGMVRHGVDGETFYVSSLDYIAHRHKTFRRTRKRKI